MIFLDLTPKVGIGNKSKKINKRDHIKLNFCITKETISERKGKLLDARKYWQTASVIRGKDK